jgi:hypothetical protein
MGDFLLQCLQQGFHTLALLIGSAADRTAAANDRKGCLL